MVFIMAKSRLKQHLMLLLSTFIFFNSMRCDCVGEATAPCDLNSLGGNVSRESQERITSLEAARSAAGWIKYFEENIKEFHDILLEWRPTGHDPLPDWLTGTYVRNGPARLSFESPRRQLTSWLEGFGKLHSFKFDGQRLLFSGKMMEPPNYKASVTRGELTPQKTLNKFHSLEEEWNLFEKITITAKDLMMTAYDNNNIMVWRLGKKDLNEGIYIATTDVATPTRFNISDLSTIEVLYPNYFPLTINGCAHFLREPGTDNSINFQRKKNITGGGVYVELQRYRPEDNYQSPQVITRFQPRKLSNVHSFSLTENYAIFFFYPVIIDPKKYFSANFHVFELFEELVDELTDVYVIHLKTGKVMHHQTVPSYAAHHVNAYENHQNELIVDICPQTFVKLRDYFRIENLRDIEHHYMMNFSLNEEVARFRIKLDQTGSKIQSIEKEDDFPNPMQNQLINRFDMPVINENHRGKKYCIVYGWSSIGYSDMALVKKNLCDASQDKMWREDSNYPSEPVFLQTPGATEEDDGVVISIVFDGYKEMSYLVMLNASSWEEMGRLNLPHAIPWSIHGVHFPEAQFQIPQ